MSGPWLQPLGRLLELPDNSRGVVLGPHGSVFAWTSLRIQEETETISSWLVAAPSGSAVAFAAAARESNEPQRSPAETRH